LNLILVRSNSKKERGSMSKIPPEKYYEACITYNLIYDFEMKLDTKLYPFSISQIEEKDKGYDFGYKLSNDSFFVQYKRPNIYETKSEKFNWKIDIEQLKVINNNNFKLKTYYALPWFIDVGEWYHALDLTYFIDAVKLKYILKNKANNKSAIINSTNKSLKPWCYCSEARVRVLKNLAYDYSAPSITFSDIREYVASWDEETKNRTWFYAIRKD